MPEDCICIGFEFFSFEERNYPGQKISIANEMAVERAGGNLLNQIAHDAAFEKLAVHALPAVQAAALRKFERLDDGQDNTRNGPPDDPLDTGPGLSDFFSGDDFSF